MLEERKDTKIDMKSRSMRTPPLTKSRSHDAVACSIQDHHYCNSLPPRPNPMAHGASMIAVQNHRYSSSLPPLPKPRHHSAALSSVQDRRFRSSMRGANRIGNGSVTTDPWKRHAPQQPPPGLSSRWGHPESVLAVVLLTVFLLFLPLVLPQLTPPPVALLLIPLAIMAASLLVLAFLPSESQTAASSYV